MGRLLGKVALLTLTVALATAGSAAAAPTWLAPFLVSGANPGSGAADIAVAADGRAVVVWSSASKVQAAVRPPGGPWGPPVDLVSSGGDCCPSVTVDATGKAYAAYRACIGAPSTCHVWVRTLPPGAAAWTAAEQISGPQFPEDIGIAADPAGNTIIVWTHYNAGHYPSYARYRAAGGLLGPVDTISYGDPGCCPRVDVAMGGNGTAHVVWSFRDFSSFQAAVDGVVYGRARKADGTWVPGLAAPPHTLGGPYANNLAYDPHVAADPTGNALATWRAADGTPMARTISPVGVPGTPVVLAASTGNTSPPWPALDPSGTATVAWCEPAQAPATGYLVRVNRRLFGAAFQGAFTIGEPESSKCLPRTAAGPGGAAAVVWLRPLDKVIRANVQPSGGSFGAAHDLSTVTGTAGANFNASVAFDGSGDAVATWQRSGAVEAAAYDSAAPEARSLSVPTEGITNAPVAFSVSPFDIWSAASVAWDFGDGVGSGAAAPSHAYPLAGRYVVTLTLTDAVGNASSTTRTLLITDPPASPSSSPSAIAPTAVDGDRDGFPGGLDCDDSNAATRPGGREIPGNTIDEDCNGIAEPRPRITSPVTWDGRLDGRRGTIFLRLRVTDLPANATVELRCRGARCPFKKRAARRRSGDTLNLLPVLGRKRRLAPGLTFELWIRAPQVTGKVIRFRTNRRRFPAGVTMCLPVGKSVPQRVCA